MSGMRKRSARRIGHGRRGSYPRPSRAHPRALSVLGTLALIAVAMSSMQNAAAQSTPTFVVSSVVRCEGAVGTAWPAPVGHCQPRRRDIPTDFGPSASRAEQETLEGDIARQLEICRGC
jgi:hypothetical protein